TRGSPVRTGHPERPARLRRAAPVGRHGTFDRTGCPPDRHLARLSARAAGRPAGPPGTPATAKLGVLANHPHEGYAMLSWAITFLIIAIIAGVLGFGGIAGTATGIAKILFIIFLVLFVASFLFGRFRGP